MATMRWTASPRSWSLIPLSGDGYASLMVQAATYVCLGNGLRAKLWSDKWLPDRMSISESYPALATLVRDSGVTVARALDRNKWIRDIHGGIYFTGAYDVDGARDAILGYVQNRKEQRVIYFHGWSGLGASAVLRSIAEVLPSRRAIPELRFDRIIFIDCSEWKSRRSMQRAIAEELKLDPSIMDILDKQDEEDDFHGVHASSRNEITDVSREIYHILKDSRFVMIFCNGSDDEIDLYRSGVPPFGKFADNTLIWTYGRRLLTRDQDVYGKLRLTHLFAFDRTTNLTGEQFYALLCKEAAIVAAGIDPTKVADCCLYKLFLQGSFRNPTKCDWAGNASSCWICDGILHEDIKRDISNALHRKISFKCDDSLLLDDVFTKFKEHLKLPFIRVKGEDVYEEGPYRWISITSEDTELHGLQIIPAQTSSFILEFRSKPARALENGLFEHSSILGVLILCCADFSFASPPFGKCHSLKFLRIDHCTDNTTWEVVEDHTEWACLYGLRVLDLRSTYWNEILSQEKIDLMDNIRELNIEGAVFWEYATSLEGRLPNLERLRIMKQTDESEISKDTINSFLRKKKLQVLDLSGNSDMVTLPSNLSKVSSLQVLVLDGCTMLRDVVPDVLPRLLRSFRLDGYGPPAGQTPRDELPMEHHSPSAATDKKGANNISKISLKGCTQLDNIFLRGLPNLVELDLSGSAIKVLDFETMVTEVPELKRLFLLGCQHLGAIRWKESVFYRSIRPELELLCIDTRAGTVRPWLSSLGQNNKPFRLQVHAVVEDARLGWSLWSQIYAIAMDVDDVYFNIRVTSSPVQLKAICSEKTGLYGDQVSMQRSVPASQYIHVLSMVSDAAMQAFPEPPTTDLDRHIEIAQGSRGLESALDGDSRGLGNIMRLSAESLHVHDVSFSGSMPVGRWDSLKQCRMERCPKLDPVFCSSEDGFGTLETLWAFDLLMARHIWSQSSESRPKKPDFGRNLQHLHLSSCPRLQFVLLVYVSAFPNLETLHIIHCGDLKHVFVLDAWYPKERIVTNGVGVAFPKLTAVHLHDLPTLRQICDLKMVAPKLESIKIRGCWSLRRLPVVEARVPGMKKPTVEIEKDVWDALEWDGVEAGHHPSHFEAPVHSRYYKKKLPRTSVLR